MYIHVIRLNCSKSSLILYGTVASVDGLNRNVVGHINEVNRRRARPVLGWVTVYRRVSHLGM